MQLSNAIEKTLSSEADTLAFAQQFASLLPWGTVVFLYGSLGAGKTTFVRGLLRGLGYEGKVKSPTYTLVEPYEFPEGMICHFDLYRLNDANELLEIGIEEYFSARTICLIEWPDKGMPNLPSSDLDCYLNFLDGGRSLRIVSHSQKGEEILQQLR